MKLKMTLGLAAGLLMAQAAHAEGLSYDYVEGGYRYFTWNAAAGYPDHVYNGVLLEGSKSLNDRFFVQGKVGYVESSWNDPGDHEELEETDVMASIGARFPINANTDLNVSIGMFSYNNTISSQKDKRTCTYDDSGEYVVPGLAVRHKINDKTELSAKYEFWAAHNDKALKDLAYLRLGVAHEVAPGYKFGLTLSHETEDGRLNGADIYLRREF